MPDTSSGAAAPVQAKHDLLSRQVTADLVGICKRTLDGWVRAGVFPAPLRLGHPTRPLIRFRRADVEEYLSRAAREVTHAG